MDLHGLKPILNLPILPKRIGVLCLLKVGRRADRRYRRLLGPARCSARREMRAGSARGRVNVYRYTIGQIIHHRHYDYRGVIVETDGECRANDAWYRHNRTQPTRDQPWYHVLVDGGNETYVAEENLELDARGEKVKHPLLDKMFPTFYDGRYYRQSFN